VIDELSAIEGYRLWSRTYDDTLNPLLALEMRILSAHVKAVAGTWILDAGCGTGRWMNWAQSRGACVFGIDACYEMLLKARQKPGLEGHSALADVQAIPFEDDAVDLAMCSFTIGYLQSPSRVIQELARVSRRLIVTDLHPDAVRAGWTRSFRDGDRIYQLKQYEHSIAELDACARRTGFVFERRIEACFDEPEREIFRRAGKENAFDQTCHIPAVLISIWRK
jgi:ubiquinone/menaquinone biosynthesis C-methylase UbiE